MIKIKHLEHYALWVFMFFFIFDYHYYDGNWTEAISSTSAEIIMYMALFYLNYLILIPTFLSKKRIGLYIVSIIAFLFTFIAVIKLSGLEVYLYEESNLRNLMSMTINFGLFWLISTLYWYYKTQQEERERHLQLKNEKLEAEMRFLKNQISPHFIFNTLNNIYSLVQQGHKNAAPMLAKLSTILRYLLYDSSKEQVDLQKELDTIKEYIELQLFRKPKSSNVDFYTEGNTQNFKITPLLLLNFVENCFKHSDLDLSEDAWIKISCIVEDNQHLAFATENSVSSKTFAEKEGGLGNKNIQRQLELIYPNNHELKVSEIDGVYSTILNLKLAP